MLTACESDRWCIDSRTIMFASTGIRLANRQRQVNAVVFQLGIVEHDEHLSGLYALARMHFDAFYEPR